MAGGAQTLPIHLGHCSQVLRPPNFKGVLGFHWDTPVALTSRRVFACVPGGRRLVPGGPREYLLLREALRGSPAPYLYQGV